MPARKPREAARRVSMSPFAIYLLFGVVVPELENENPFLIGERLAAWYGLKELERTKRYCEPLPEDLRVGLRADVRLEGLGHRDDFTLYMRKLWRSHGCLLQHPRKHPWYARFGPPGVKVGA